MAKSEEQIDSEYGSTIKHPKPKILMVDIENEATKVLRKEGWKVTIGTFGRPYKVDKSDGFVPVIVKYSLPNYNEQEIVIIDLYQKDVAEGPEAEKHVPPGEPDLWAKCNKGWVDPRIRSMNDIKDASDRILYNGGVFVVFSDCKKHQDLAVAQQGSYNNIWNEKSFKSNIWDFLTVLENIDVKTDDGHEMQIVSNNPIADLASRHLKNGKFFCVVEPRWQWTSKNTEVIIVNKFDAPVGLVHYGNKGLIIVLPQLANKPVILLKLLEEVLPGIVPHLFPTLEQGRWTQRVEYELPRVVELEAKKLEIENKAQEEIEALSKEVERERERELLGWMYDLLSGHDKPLVEAVKKALHELGFKKVVDVDAERDKEGKSRREDLQIHDQSPVLIVDIKGIGGIPGDAETLQADKHATIRMREWKRTDVVPLSIINHQRHLPPLDRNNDTTFRQEILDHAEESQLGLMTTWDLFRLVRSFQKNGWKSENVMPLLYQKGRIAIVPTNYRRLGKVSHVWKDAFSVMIEDGEIRVNDRLAFELTSEFEEREVASLQVEEKAVQIAGAASDVGVKTTSPQPRLKKGMAVYLVQKK